MSRSSALILVGILAMLTPFSGLPGSFRTLIAVVLGAVVLGIGLAERARAARPAPAPNPPAGPPAPAVESARTVSPI